MPNELMLCVPGPWRDRADFLRALVTAEPAGHYFYAGNLLADVHTKEHVTAEWYERDAGHDMRLAFELAGAGRLSPTTLDDIVTYRSVVYLRFPLPVTTQGTGILKFSRLLRQIGGYAVKVETSGIAHEWDGWEALLQSQDPFHWYLAFVTLIGSADRAWYYSCGMHHFEEAEAEIPAHIPPDEAARLLNNFNLYRLSENPSLGSGHTLSLGSDGQTFEMQLHPDTYHEVDDLFHNPHGIWRLIPQ